MGTVPITGGFSVWIPRVRGTGDAYTTPVDDDTDGVRLTVFVCEPSFDHQSYVTVGSTQV